MDADEARGVGKALGERGDRQGRGVGGEDHARLERRLSLRIGLGLHLAVLEHGFDDEVAVGERGIVGGRGDARDERVALRRGGAAAVDLVADQLCRMRLAALRGLLVAVDQHDVDAGERGDVADARAHEAGADDADAFRRAARQVRPARALVELLHRHEQRAHHRRRLRRAQDFREPAGFHTQREVERQLQALVDDLQDRPCGRIIVVGLAPVDRVRRREGHHAGLGIDGAARQLEAVEVPRVLGLAAGLDPVLRRLHEVVGRHDRVDQLHRPRALDLDLVALEKELQRVGWRQHAGDARRAAGAGKQPDLDLRQPEARLRILRRDAVVAGERELEAAADRGAVDGGDPRLAAGLDPPIEQRELAALLEQAGRRLLLAVAGKLLEGCGRATRGA